MKDSDAESLGEIIAAYLQRCDADEAVDVEEIIQLYPQYRDALLKFARQTDLLNSTEDRSASDFSTDDLADTVGGHPNWIADYQIGGLLGRGGMSTVYRASPIDNSDEQVALKVFDRSFATDRSLFRRAWREATAIESLDHPHIVSLRRFDQCEGRPYLAMQLIEGLNLGQFINRARHEETHEDRFIDAAKMIQRVADALAYAHHRGIIHRDIKPSNLLLDHDGKVWLTDFGLASLGDSQTRLTGSGQILGTPQYMSPEQAMGQSRVDARSDVYSLGATLYHLVTRQPPFTGDRLQIWYKVIQGRFIPLRKVEPDIPASLEAIICKAMSLSPRDRYESAAAFADDLRRFTDHQPVKARRPNVFTHLVAWINRNPGRAVSYATVAAILVVLLFTFQFINSRRLASVNQELTAANSVLAQGNAELDRMTRQLRRHLYIADVSAAYEAYAQNDIAGAQELLSRHWSEIESPATSSAAARSTAPLTPQHRSRGDSEATRGIEWWILHHLLHPAERRSMGRHEGAAREVAVAGDSSRFVSVGDDGMLRHWDSTTGKSVAANSIGGRLDALAVSPDGASLLTGVNIPVSTNSVMLYQTEDLHSGMQIGGHTYSIESAAFSLDGKYMATAGRYHDVQIYDAGGEPLHRIRTGSRNESVAFTGDNQSLLTAYRKDPDTSQQETLAKWDVATGQLQQEWEFDEPVKVVAVASQTHQVVAATVSTVYQIDNKLGTVAADSGLVRGRVRCVAISEDGRRIAAGCDNGSLYVWTMSSDQAAAFPAPQVFSIGHGRITSVCFLADRYVATSSESGHIDLVTTSAPIQINNLSSHGNHFAPDTDTDSRTILYRERHSGTVSRLDLTSLQSERIMEAPTESSSSRLAATRDNGMLACISSDRLCWATIDEQGKTRTPIGRAELPQEVAQKECRDIRFSRDPTRLYLLYNDRMLEYSQVDDDWSLASTIRIAREDAQGLALSSDGRHLTVVGHMQMTHFLTEDLSRYDNTPQRTSMFSCAAYSSDSRWLAAGREDGTIELLDVATGRLVGSLRGHHQVVRDIVFLANDETLATIGSDETLQFWDRHSGRSLGRLTVTPGSDDQIFYDSRNQRLLTSGHSAGPQLWDARRTHEPLGR